MSRRRELAACAAFVITCAGARTLDAAEPPHEPEVPPAPEAALGDVPAWAVVVAVGLAGGLASNVAGPIGGLGGLGPALGASVERRVFERGWLFLDAGGSYARAADGWGGQARSFGLEGSVGLRHALTSPEVLEVSWYAALDGGYGESAYDGAGEATSARAGVEAGLVLDKAFADWFGLRLRTSLVSVGYARTVASPADGPESVARSLVASLSLEPRFALRFAF